jgi:hypothetical protein
VISEPDFFPAVWNDGMVEIKWVKDQNFMKNFMQVGKRRDLMICENYEDTFGNYRGKSIKISCPPEEQGTSWVSLDGELMNKVDKYVSV